MAKRTVNSKLFSETQKHLVGGVNSPVRAFNYVGGDPLVVKNGRGSKIYDYDGNEYIDYVLSWGSLILGHAFPEVVNTVKETVSGGLSFGTTNIKEVELARLIKRAMPFVEKIRFVNSGTEAVMGAVRLARGYTGRDKIIKFEHSYHGHADYLLVSGGSGLATLGIPQSLGIPRDFIKHTIVIPYGDHIRLDRIFERYGKEIAAVLVEPVGGNYGVVPPDIRFIGHLRNVTKKYKALLISDEVITGFRFNFGSLIRRFGITPDLICLGKIIGGGLPIGAYGARREIMDQLAPLGRVYQASTFAGNPVVMQAGIATIKALAALKKEYKRLEKLTKLLSSALEEEAGDWGIDLKIRCFESVFSLRFGEKKDFEKFYRGMLKAGVYFAPSEFEANFLSFAHTKRDINKTIDSAKAVLAGI